MTHPSDPPNLVRDRRRHDFSVALTNGERWYAAHTLPQGEMRALGHLENQSFRAFLPKRHKTVRHARKLSTVDAPYFPRYLFVALDLNRQQWRRVNSTSGVSRLIMRGDWPQPVPQGVVEALIASADERGVLHLAGELRVGGAVRLMAGPFADQIAILDSLDDTGRVLVLLSILGRQVAISTEADDLLPLP